MNIPLRGRDHFTLNVPGYHDVNKLLQTDRNVGKLFESMPRRIKIDFAR